MITRRPGMTSAVEGASNKPLKRPAARIRSLAAAHWQRWPAIHGRTDDDQTCLS